MWLVLVVEMSLVAYYSSSGEDSDSEEATEVAAPKLSAVNGKPSTSTQNAISDESDSGGKDDDDDEPIVASSIKMNLPKPSQPNVRQRIEEEDDEFLHKKSDAYADIEKPPPPKPSARAALKPRVPVKITIPSLSDFEKETGPTVPRDAGIAPQPRPKGGGLMNLLPPPKVALGGGKSTLLSTASTSTASRFPMIPHAVKKQIDNRKAAASKPSATATTALPGLGYNSSDSDDSDAEDFFSLNDERKLPEISATEIQKMVASKSAKLAEASHKLDKELENSRKRAQEEYAAMQAEATRRSEMAIEKQRRDRDIEALCGTRAKRARGHEEIEFIEVSHNEVMPKREEWQRTQLAGETQYQPKGLVGYDGGAGTKKKHQITYLAHQAKANESELQAMWAANRQARAQTSNKYGF